MLRDKATLDDVMKTRPEAVAPLLGLSQNIMRGKSRFSLAEREFIAAYVSGLNQSDYCHGAHLAFAESHGVSAEQLACLAKPGDRGEGLGARWRSLLAFCRKLTLEPATIAQSDYQQIFNDGWTEQDLSDLIWVVGLFNLYNRLAEGHGLQPRSAEANRLVADYLKPIGYDYQTYRKRMAG